jgi:hypothetical protein
VAAGSSETAFETFKGFEGKWAIRSGQKTLPIEMPYESDSKGSVVSRAVWQGTVCILSRRPKPVDDTLSQRWQSATVAIEGEYQTWGL